MSHSQKEGPCGWFMHDGAPPHFSLVPRQFLDENYGKHLWPPK